LSAVLITIILAIAGSGGGKTDCGDWILQTDGTEWRLCMMAMNQYCEELDSKDNGQIGLVKCTPK
jgi:hypothetical protein